MIRTGGAERRRVDAESQDGAAANLTCPCLGFGPSGESAYLILEAFVSNPYLITTIAQSDARHILLLFWHKLGQEKNLGNCA
jgi:hypothetical protein